MSILKNKIIICLIVFVLFANVVSATELKLVKVSDLKTGDVVIDKYGNEIKIENIVVQPKESLSISEYLSRKVYGDGENKSNSLVGFVISGQEAVSDFKFVENIKSFFGRIWG